MKNYLGGPSRMELYINIKLYINPDTKTNILKIQLLVGIYKYKNTSYNKNCNFIVLVKKGTPN